MPKISVNDIQIHYQIDGKGERLLYIGGTGSDLRHHPGVFDSPLADHFEVLAYDQRGFGQTSKPDIPYSMADYAADAAELLRTVGWDATRIVGVSFGGMVAQELLVEYPELVKKTALLCTSSGGKGGNSYPLHFLSSLPVPEQARKMLELADTRWNKSWQQANATVFDAMLNLKTAQMQPLETDFELRMGSVRQLEARKRHNTWERLAQIKSPVGVFGGRYDGIALPANVKKLQEQIPNATLEMFDGGHLFFQQDQSAWPAIIKFLR